MRSLLEILEAERTLNQKLESIYRYLGRVDDVETFDILAAQKKRIEADLDKTRNEIREYLEEMLNGGEHHE